MRWVIKKIDLKSLNTVSKFVLIGLFLGAVLFIILGFYGCTSTISTNIERGISCFIIAGFMIAVAVVLKAVFSAIFEIADSVNELINKVDIDAKKDE